MLTDLLWLPVLTVNPRLLSGLQQMELPAGRSGQLLYFLETKYINKMQTGSLSLQRTKG